VRYAAEVKVRPGTQKSNSTSLAAPVGGLNARDSIANMKPTDAIILENYFPNTTSVDVRNGYSAWSTFTGLAQSILVYSGLTSTKVFPCVKNGSTYSIYNGTTAGALSTAVVGGGGATVQALTSCRFDYVQYGTDGGSFLRIVNGADTAIGYDGTTWTTVTLTHASLASTDDLFTVGVFGERLWFAEKDTFNVFYLPVRTVSGAMERLNLGSWFKLGGYLNSIITLTDDASGLVDYICFLSSEGEVLAYTGSAGVSDPAVAANWIQAAHFRIGRPVIKGNRTWCKYGVDALVLCADGVYPLRKAFASQTRDGTLAVSDKIRSLLNYDILTHGSKYGWTCMVHPTGSKLIVNVPTAEDSASYQWVMHTNDQAWCKFAGWSAFCFEVARDTLWMGMNGKMVKADTGAIDGTTAITAEAKQAFNYLGRRGSAKHVKMLRPILSSNGAFSLSVSVDVDYTNTDPTYLRAVSGGSGDPWGGIWDVAWLGSMTLQSNWYGVTGVGHSMAVHLKSQTSDVSLSWSATDIVYEGGGILA